MQELIGFYSKAQVLDLTTFGDTTLWRQVKAGKFPKPIKLSPGRVAFPRKAVHDWLAAHGAAPAGEAA
jgi:prophage regulatory protein